MSNLSIKKAAAEFDTLTEEERRALRISRFHAQPPPPPTSHESRTRLAHPGGDLATNKAAALVKFLQRKLNEPGGAATLDPALVERAVDNAKGTFLAGQEPAASSKKVRVRHVNSFSDSDEDELGQKGGKLQKHVNLGNKRKKNKSEKADLWIASSDSKQNGHSASSKKKKNKKKRKKKHQG